MSKLTRIDFQKWLIGKGKNVGNAGADGIIGKATKAAVFELFRDLKAKAVTNDELKQLSILLGDNTGTAKIRAVAEVESGGNGWLNDGLVKILYERHKFWKYNNDTSAPKSTFFNYPTGGNYTIDADNNDINDSWEKLLRACEFDPLAAFMSVSMGKFQVMGFHYALLGFKTPWDMMYSLVSDEKKHYELLVRYIKVNHLSKAFVAINGIANNCRAFAAGYNGSGYVNFNYHVKIANAYTKYKNKGY